MLKVKYLKKYFAMVLAVHHDELHPILGWTPRASYIKLATAKDGFC